MIKDDLKSLIKVLNKLNIRVEIRDFSEDGLDVANLKNNKIKVSNNSRDTLSIIFTIAHLFGHLIQYRNYDKYRYLVESIQKVKKDSNMKFSKAFKEAFKKYEYEAFRFGKHLMEKSFKVTDEIDKKYIIFYETDFNHFWNYIETRTGSDIKSFNKLLTEKYKDIDKMKKKIPSLEFSESFKIPKANIIVN